MELLKAIRKTCLTKLKLRTFWTETEEIINSGPLVYLEDDLNDRVALLESHFLLLNTKNGTPLIKNDDDIEDPTYFPANIWSKETLLSTWKKG